MQKVKKQIRLLLPLAILLISLIVGFTANSKNAYSASGQNCGSEYSVLANGSSGSQLAGITNLTLAATSTTTKISKVIFRANDKPIGRAQATNNLYTWSMPWLTSLYPNSNNVYIDAEVYISGQNSYCAANGYTTNVFNPEASNLSTFVVPQEWRGPMSFSFTMSAKVWATNPDFDPTPFALYSWIPSIGTISSNSYSTAQYFSGQTVGSGNVVLSVKYGGKTAAVKVPIIVESNDSPLPDPEDTTITKTTSETGDDNVTAEERVISELRESTLQNNVVAQDCVVATIGDERFKAINSGEVRPTQEEIQKFKVCFASSNYILPSNFAPVAPSAVKELAVNKETRINNPINTTVKKDDNEIEALQFSGITKPNSLIILYVFSDPLVLTTTANENGEWTYTLEDPIEPGDHEVYSVVDRGDGIYERSDPLSFSIAATAEAAEGNPSGLSLRLSDTATPKQSKKSLVLYAGATGAILVLIVVSLLYLMKRKAKNQPEPINAGEVSQVNPIDTNSGPGTVINTNPQPDNQLAEKSDNQKEQ